VNTLVTVAMVFGLAVIAAWLWMAQANGQGKNWARILCTVLFGLATLELIRVRPECGVRAPGRYGRDNLAGGRVQQGTLFARTLLPASLAVALQGWRRGRRVLR
jgi:hypothetical protein